jgi:hypothetical protein
MRYLVGKVESQVTGTLSITDKIVTVGPARSNLRDVLSIIQGNNIIYTRLDGTPTYNAPVAQTLTRPFSRAADAEAAAIEYLEQGIAPEVQLVRRTALVTYIDSIIVEAVRLIDNDLILETAAGDVRTPVNEILQITTGVPSRWSDSIIDLQVWLESLGSGRFYIDRIGDATTIEADTVYTSRGRQIVGRLGDITVTMPIETVESVRQGDKAWFNARPPRGPIIPDLGLLRAATRFIRNYTINETIGAELYEAYIIDGTRINSRAMYLQDGCIVLANGPESWWVSVRDVRLLTATMFSGLSVNTLIPLGRSTPQARTVPIQSSIGIIYREGDYKPIFFLSIREWSNIFILATYENDNYLVAKEEIGRIEYY